MDRLPTTWDKTLDRVDVDVPFVIIIIGAAAIELRTRRYDKVAQRRCSTVLSRIPCDRGDDIGGVEKGIVARRFGIGCFGRNWWGLGLDWLYGWRGGRIRLLRRQQSLKLRYLLYNQFYA